MFAQGKIMTPVLDSRGSHVVVSGLFKRETWEGRLEQVAILLSNHDWCPGQPRVLHMLATHSTNPRVGAWNSPEIKAQDP